MRHIILSIIVAACTLTVQAQQLSVATQQVEPQQQWQVSVALQTDEPFAALQLEMQVDADYSIEAYNPCAALANHTLRTNIVDVGTHRVVVYSAKGNDFALDGDTQLFTFDLHYNAGSLANGDYQPVRFSSVVLARNDGSEVAVAAPTLSITSEGDGVTAATASSKAVAVYTLDGRLVSRDARRASLQHGLYIINGKKVRI